jgi:hypothetical protein
VSVYIVKPETKAFFLKLWCGEVGYVRACWSTSWRSYVSYGGKVATTEAIVITHYGQLEVISVDYRMRPDFSLSHSDRRNRGRLERDVHAPGALDSSAHLPGAV